MIHNIITGSYACCARNFQAALTRTRLFLLVNCLGTHLIHIFEEPSMPNYTNRVLIWALALSQATSMRRVGDYIGTRYERDSRVKLEVLRHISSPMSSVRQCLPHKVGMKSYHISCPQELKAADHPHWLHYASSMLNFVRECSVQTLNLVFFKCGFTYQVD